MRLSHKPQQGYCQTDLYNSGWSYQKGTHLSRYMLVPGDVSAISKQGGAHNLPKANAHTFFGNFSSAKQRGETNENENFLQRFPGCSSRNSHLKSAGDRQVSASNCTHTNVTNTDVTPRLDDKTCKHLRYPYPRQHATSPQQQQQLSAWHRSKKARVIRWSDTTDFIVIFGLQIKSAV